MSAAEPLAVAVLGQGSIGRRHAGLLVAQGCRVLVWDPAPAGEAVPGTTGAADAASALAEADAAVIASPSLLHLEQLALALDHACDVLVEKPLAVSAEGVAELVARAQADGRIAATAMNLRFHPGPAAVREVLESGAIGRPLVAHATFGSHLPGWRPDTDYRRAYSARADLGGGILRDAIHEIDYVTWMLGDAVEVGGWMEHVSDLELDVEDVALLTLRHASGALTTIDLDFLDRSYRRGIRIVGSDGSVDWSWAREDVRVLAAGSERVIAAPSDVAPSYGEQMRAFLASVRARRLAPPLCDLAAGLRAVRVADAARASARDGSRVDLS
jgi:predicted dehydrogenase